MGEEKKGQEQQQEERQEKQKAQGRDWFRIFVAGGIVVAILLLVWIGIGLLQQPAEVDRGSPAKQTEGDIPEIVGEDVVRIEDPGLSMIHTKKVEKEGNKLIVYYEWQKRPEKGEEYIFAAEGWDNSVQFKEEKMAKSQKTGGDESDRGKMTIELCADQHERTTHARIVATGECQLWESSGGFVPVGGRR